MNNFVIKYLEKRILMLIISFIGQLTTIEPYKITEEDLINLSIN